MNSSLPPPNPQFSLADILEATGGSLLQPSLTLDPTAKGPLSTDTRQLAEGDWYIPLVGERFNGHDFLEKAIAIGVSGCLIQQNHVAQWPAGDAEYPAIVVADTTLAYQQLAGWYRRTYCPNTTVVGITGSSGKTTVKEMLLATLSPTLNTRATIKNHNNDIGVAQTLLSCTPDTDVLIVEMGMRGLGEIERLSRIAQPAAALIVSLGPAHIGRLGSMEAIAQAKAEIFTGLTHGPRLAQPVAMIPDGEPLLEAQLASAPPVATIVRFPTQHTNTTETVAWQGMALPLPAPGSHMAANVCAVATLAQALGLSPEQIQYGLSHYRPTDGRGTVFTLEDGPAAGSILIQDAYNANPASMLASLKATLAAYPNHTPVLVLGGMKELGTFEAPYHAELGTELARLLNNHPRGTHAVVELFGEEFSPTEQALHSWSGERFWHPLSQSPDETTLSQWATHILGHLPAAPWVMLVKGSRYYQLDTLATHIMTQLQPIVVPA